MGRNAMSEHPAHLSEKKGHILRQLTLFRTPKNGFRQAVLNGHQKVLKQPRILLQKPHRLTMVAAT